MTHRLALASALLLALLAVGYCSTHIPAGPDVESANAVGHFISDGYGKFEDRQQLNKTDKGKTYYVGPESNRNTTLDFYEIETAEDMARIEELARGALVAVPSANSITLKFYRVQNMPRSPGGGGSRGSEQLLKKVTIERSSR